MRLKKAVLSLVVAAMVCMTNLGSMSSLDAAENETVTYGVVSFDAETGVETYEEISFPAQRSAVEVMERAEICVNNELSSTISENSVEFDAGFDENTIAPLELSDDGVDNRTRVVSPKNYAQYRSICRLILHNEDGSTGIGTGFVLSETAIVTAGHCVYDRDGGNWWNQLL